jgi:hypothetical protein
MNKLSILIFLAALLLLPTSTAISASDYVGADQCFSCHAEQFNDWQASGHPYKLRKAEKARYTGLPLPPGYTWDDISYVIGGSMRKARYINQEGFVITTAKDGSEAKTQYNLEDGSWSFYHKGEKKPYKCGPCHMTNYSPKGNQDGRKGMIGTWSADGISCEECHGAGSDHIQDPKADNIVIKGKASDCGKCHQRGGQDIPPLASGGFIKHHEQINELLSSPHGEMDCIECHNPHKRADNQKVACISCHDDQAEHALTTIHGKSGVTCKECHMPKASKSATKKNSNIGDLRTHIFNINTDPKGEMFKTVEKDGKKTVYANDAVTLNYSCLGCHGARDLDWAAKNAKGYHGK